jgi:YidC/Oxa1 family membrane protein insertase
LSIPGWNVVIQALVWVLTQIDSLIHFVPGHAGFTIIIFTIVIKLILMPLTLKGLHSSRAMQEIQPQIKEIQKKYAKDKEKLSAETMALYKEHGVNPMGGCLPMLVQLPIFFAMYGAILELARGGFAQAFLWLPNLSLPDPWYILPVAAVVFQFVQQRMMTTPAAMQDPQQRQMNRMMQFMPLMIGIFAFSFSSGAVIYWVTSSIFSVVQQYFVTGWGTLPDVLKIVGLGPKNPTTKPAPKQVKNPATKAALTSSGNGAQRKALSSAGGSGVTTRRSRRSLDNAVAASSSEAPGSNQIATDPPAANASESAQEQKAMGEVYTQVGLKQPKKKKAKR